MIPKRLFFIWIGPNPPKYVDFAINAFKTMNPDFEIEYIHEDSRNSSNADFKETMELINTKYSYFYKIWNTPWRRKNLSTTEKQLNIRFSDVLRHYLINKYGGIYLDCDTYPIKPFDDKLLAYKSFKIWGEDMYVIDRKWTDIFFMGAMKGKVAETYKHIPYKAYNIDSIDKVPQQYLKNRDNFRNCVADFDLKYCLKNNYIIHFREFSWCSSI